MKKPFKKKVVEDLVEAKKLKCLVEEIDGITFNPPSPVVIEIERYYGLHFDFNNNRYNISALGLEERFSRVEFPIFQCEKGRAKELSRTEKRLMITSYGIRCRLQMQGFKLFTPEYKIADTTMRRIFNLLLLARGEYMINNDFILDLEELDAQFISNMAIYYYRKGANLDSICQVLCWQPKLLNTHR